MSIVNHEAEQNVLGGLLLDNSTWDQVAGKVSESDYSDKRHRLIFRAIRSLADDGEPFDVVTVAEHLEHTGHIRKAGGLPYLTSLVEGTVGVGNIHVHAGIVREKAIRRALRDLFAGAAKEAETGDLDNLLGDVTTRAESVASQSTESLCFSEAFEHAMNFIDDAAAARQRGGVVGVPTGIPGIDTRTGGLQRKRLIILAARPTIGKTASSNQIALHAAKKGYPIGIISLEMGHEELVMRMMGNHYRVTYSGLQYGDEREIKRLSDAMGNHSPISALPIHIDTSTTSLGSIAARITEWRRKHGIELAIVDHIGLIEGGDGSTRNDWMGKVSRTLKLTAKRLDMPILAVSQLNRTVERDKRRPVLADLRDSGNIEQDADTCIFLHVDAAAQETQMGLPIEIGLLKNRTGRRGWLPERFYFDGRTQTFRETAEPMQQQPWTSGADRAAGE